MLTGALVLLVLFRRGDQKQQRHEGAKLASLQASDGQPFSLSVAAPADGALLAYLRYVVEYPGMEEEYRLSCHIEARLEGELVFEEALGIHYGPPTAGSGERQVTTEYRVSVVTRGPGYRRESRVLLGEIEAANAGQAIALEGRVKAQPPTAIRDLEVYLVPAAHRL